jgi:arylsulfatase A
LKASNAPFRSGGTTVYEGGVRVPALFRWRGRLPAGSVCSAMLSHLDILPLCLHLAGLPLPEDRIIDGKNPLPALAGEPVDPPHEWLAFDYNHHGGLRLGDWKIVRPGAGRDWELYRLSDDPGEEGNLAASHPDELARLLAAFAAWEEQVEVDASPSTPGAL